MPSSHRSKSSSSRRNHHVPLADDLIATGPLRTTSKKRKVRHENADEAESSYIDSRLSRKILKIGQDLQDEELQEQRIAKLDRAFTFESRIGGSVESESEKEGFAGGNRDEEAWGSDGDDSVEEAEVDPYDLDLFNKFNPVPSNESVIQAAASRPNESGESTNLADLILEKIAAHEANEERRPLIEGEGLTEDATEIPPKVVEVYSKIGLFLSRYKSGKLPKPFKILPGLPSWPDLLAITRPESWTPNACYEATRLFVSSKPHVVQEFLETVLLGRVRENIHEIKKLNVHLYKALKKALYKPAAFFKGFLFPLVSSGTSTQREAHIISSVLARVSIPVLHSAATLLRLTEIAAAQTSAASTESAGATNIFIRVLLDKKYALPYKVIDGLVFHFLRYRAVHSPAANGSASAISNGKGAELAAKEQKLPVLWHQCLLAFAQRYRNDITEDQREALLDLLLVRGHKDIGPEVRRELLQGRGRGITAVGEGEEARDGGDDTMVIDAV